MAIDRRLVFNVDWILIGATTLLTAVGMVMIMSAAQSWQRGAEIDSRTTRKRFGASRAIPYFPAISFASSSGSPDFETS